MRLAFVILVGIHGVIHVFGFLKAYNIAQFDLLKLEISKFAGVFWLIAFLLFIASIYSFLSHSSNWFIFGILAISLSQSLIIYFWNDAKFGSILNVIILLVIFFSYFELNFNNAVEAEVTKMLNRSTIKVRELISENELIGYPTAVQKWLLYSGVVGKEYIYNVSLEQSLQMQMDPETEEWNEAKAIQYFTIDPPAFNWSVNLKMKKLINVLGRDKFENGKGEMIIKLLSLIPVVNNRNNEKINQATLQRYLAEIVWFPSAALSPYITWEAIDDFSAKATIEYMGTKGSGVFYFDSDGAFKKFIAMRFKDVDENSTLLEWVVSATKTERKDGIKIPVELEASWKLENGYWTWLKLQIESIKYNFNKEN